MKCLRRASLRNSRRSELPRQYSFEQLEQRRVLAVAVSLSGDGDEVTFAGYGEFSNLDLSIDESGRLRHNIDDASLNSYIDLDPTQAGDQSLVVSNATFIAIDLSWQDDNGGPVVGGAQIIGIDTGHISFVGGSLFFDWQSSSDDSSTTFSQNGFSRTSAGASTEISELGVTAAGLDVLTLLYGGGADAIDASSYAAAINVTTNGGDDMVIGTSQTDFVSTGEGSDFLDGGEGDDSLLADEQFLSPGNDTIYGGAGDDYLASGLGDDQIFGGSGLDMAYEELAEGRFVVRKRQLEIDGFVVRHHGIESFTVNGSSVADFIDARQAEGMCFLYGNGGNDIILGSDQSDSIDGGDDDDLIRGGDGDDDIHGAIGNDTVEGGAGNDWVFGEEGHDDLSGNAGADTLQGGFGDDRLEGGAGADSLNGEGGADAVFGGAGPDMLYEDSDPDAIGDSLNGGDGDDELRVSGGVNVLRGDGGNDTILAGDAGIDAIHGGAGDDLIQAALEDTFAGGGGIDTLSLVTGLTTARISNKNITLDGQTRARDGIENFSLFAIAPAVFDASGYTAGSVRFTGSQANDILIGSENADYIVGSTGSDSLYGRGGNDTLQGDIDDETVLGGSGKDDFGFYYFDNPTSLSRNEILDLLFSLGIIHDIANNEPLAALIS